MWWLLYAPLIGVGLVGVCWLLYILAFAIKPMSEGIKRDSWFMYWFLHGLCYAGWLLNIGLNVTLFALLFWDRPREYTMTQRMKRYLTGNYGERRRKIADWVCRMMLEPVDCEHCGRAKEVLARIDGPSGQA